MYALSGFAYGRLAGGGRGRGGGGGGGSSSAPWQYPWPHYEAWEQLSALVRDGLRSVGGPLQRGYMELVSTVPAVPS